MFYIIVIAMVLGFAWLIMRRISQYVDRTEAYCSAVQKALDSLNDEVDELRTTVHRLEQAQATKIWPIDISTN